jgi:flagellar export protein FliJ
MQVARSRLRTVIKVKHFQVKKAQKELAVITVHREDAEQTLDRLEDTHKSALSEAARPMKARAADLQTGRAYLQTISREISKQTKHVDQVKSEEQGKRAELLEKSQSEKMLEKLEQKRVAEQEKEKEKKSQGVLDVLAQRTKPGA